MADMSASAMTNRNIPWMAGHPLAGMAFAGLLLGAFFWLWSEHGVSVYLNYLAGAAFTCF
jgi:hypothetical protein